jgi:hypothetical protein
MMTSWQKACALLQGHQATENGGWASTTPDTVRTPHTAMTAEGQTSPQGVRNEGKDARVPRVMTPAQCRQQQQHHNAGNDASGMRAKHQHNAGKRQRCTGQTFKGQLGNNASATPATRTA